MIPSAALRFPCAAFAWTVVLFAVARLTWFDRGIAEMLAHIQWRIALWYGAPSTTAVTVDGSCSGVDLAAICAAACLAYPVPWRSRIAGVLGGAAIVLSLNTLRIGTLLAVAHTPGVFATLHSYVWPGVLAVVTIGYVLTWMFLVDRRSPHGDRPPISAPRTFSRFALACTALLLLHAVAAPWTMTSATLLRAAEWTAAAGGSALAASGVPATVQGNVLILSRGAFQVTQECLLTPLLPVYLAAAVALPLNSRKRFFALAFAAPVFLALGVVRLLVLALPSALAYSPLVAAHGFYQFAAGLVTVAAMCVWAERRVNTPTLATRAAARFAIVSCITVAMMLIGGGRWDAAVNAASAAFAHARPEPALAEVDAQGALPLLPAYQVALLTALWLAAPVLRLSRYVAALATLAAFQIGFLAVAAELTTRIDSAIHPLAVRAVALVVPIALAWMFVAVNQLGTAAHDQRAYRRFWEEVGDRFPDLGGAASTAQYLADEQRLLSCHLDLHRCRLLKTDLWDEAKNTRILQWTVDQGARATGIDLSYAIVREARHRFGHRSLEAAVADVRALPFADASFDAIYSMGTVEHFDESSHAVAELARVLKPGGRLILGVPNRYDPFLRPLMVAVLGRFGLYAYGFEKSFSRRQLRTMLERAGLQVIAETGILFVPGWLRILDLLCHTRGWVRSARVTSRAVGLFGRLGYRYPYLRRHGYLLASVGVRPRVSDRRID